MVMGLDCQVRAGTIRADLRGLEHEPELIAAHVRELVELAQRLRWQSERRDALRLRKIFDREPYTEALEAFRQEYFQRLSYRTGGDPQTIAARAGIAEEGLDRISGGERSPQERAKE